jgi:hypothetical protein
MHLISQAPLRIFTRQSLRFTEVTDTWLAQVGLGVTIWEGEYEGMSGVWLRWCAQQGAILATGQEALALSQQQLERERQRAEQETQRAAAWAARLAALGIDPATMD